MVTIDNLVIDQTKLGSIIADTLDRDSIANDASVEDQDGIASLLNSFLRKEVKDLTKGISLIVDHLICSGVDNSDIISLLCHLGNLARQSLRMEHAIEFYHNSVAYCKQFNVARELLIRCILNISKIEFMRGTSSEKVHELQMETLAHVNENNLTAEDALLMLYAGLAKHFIGEETEGHILRQKGELALRKFNNELVYNEAMPLIGWHIYLQGNFRSTIAYYENMIIAIENRQDVEIVAFAYPPIIYSYMFLGEFNRALVLNEIIYKHTLECRDFTAMILMRSLWGRILVYLDEKERSEEVLYKAYAESLQENYFWGSYYSLIALCQLHLESGNIKACFEDLLLARRVAKQNNIGRMYASPFILDALKSFETLELGNIENMRYEDELQRHINSANIHMKGVCFRHLALLDKKKNRDSGVVIEMLEKSIELLNKSGNFVELGKSYVELTRILSEVGDKARAKQYATLGWRVLGAYSDKFPSELLDLVEAERISLDIEVGLNALWLELSHVVIREQLMTKIMTQLSRQLKVECSAFIVFNHNKPQVTASQNIYVERHDSPQYQRMMGLVCHVAAKRKAITIFNKKIASAKTYVNLDSEPRFIFCLPFFYNSEVHAVLYFESYYRSSDITAKEFDCLEKFGRNISSHLFTTLFYGQPEEGTASGRTKNESSLTEDHEDYCESASETVQLIMEQISLAAKTNVPVLLTGETGVGKEYFAQELNRLSGNKGVFIKVNCGAIPETLIESELFGYERGAFTGAHQIKKGYFETANGGTIFLDEIGELSLQSQVKLLRVLQEHEIMRIGGTVASKVDFRLIAATNRDLKEEVDKGTFRSDLYYRLNVLQIEIPPLRQRKSDISKFTNFFIEKYCRELGREISNIDSESLMKLLNYDWPGNIRELDNVIHRAVLLAKGGDIVGVDLELKTAKQSINTTSIQTLEEVERNYILKVLNHCNGKVAGPNGAAALLGLKRTTLISKMGKYGIYCKNKEQ